MSIKPHAIRKIRVIGAGVMGRGIAQLAAVAGIHVELADMKRTAVHAAVEHIETMLDKLVSKGRITADESQAARARVTTIDDPLAPTDVALVIEAVREDLDTKQSLFRALEENLSPDTLFASNTSSLQVTAIATALTDPSRLAGLHFFNPVPLMRVVEVIPGVHTADRIVPTLADFVRTLGHEPVIAKDTPGFVVNHAGRGLVTEALHLLDEGIATEAQIDDICRDVLGLKMGAFELLDLTGLDVSHSVLESIWSGFYNEPRLRPSTTTRARAQAGLLGRKTGSGFYTYDNGVKITPLSPTYPPYNGTQIWTDNPELAHILTEAGIKIDEAAEPGPASVILLTPLGESAAAAAQRRGLPLPRTVGIDPLFGFSEHLSIAVHPGVDHNAGTAAVAAVASTGRGVSVVRDAPATVAQRLLASIVNTACGIAQHRIATPTDIDTAVRLGLGYPAGPLEWGERVGAEHVHTVLRSMHRETGDPRNRPSPWLTERVVAQVPLNVGGTAPSDLYLSRQR